MAHGFGAMTKSEIDILVYHLLSESSEVKDISIYGINKTGIFVVVRFNVLRLEHIVVNIEISLGGYYASICDDRCETTKPIKQDRHLCEEY